MKKQKIKTSSGFKMVTLLLSVFLVLSFQAEADTSDQAAMPLENTFMDTNLLSASEALALQSHEKNGELQTSTGSYAIIYPDGRDPVVGAKADALFQSGAVALVSFSTLPNTFLGSMNWGKKIALVNQAPVLAVHSGYGDAGVFTTGPSAFYLERLANLQKMITPLGSDAILPVLDLLNKTSADRIQTLTFVAYSFGAYKATQLGWSLELSNPKLLAKTDLLVLEVGVRASSQFHSVLQIMGNRDQFGRINSTDLLAPENVLSRDFLILSNSPRALPVPPVAEIPELLHLRALRADDLPIDQMSSEEQSLAADALEAQIANLYSMTGEAVQLAGTGVTDDLHLAELNLELQKAIRNYNQIHLRLTQAGDGSALASYKKAADQAQKNVDVFQQSFDSTNLLRTGLTDTGEFEAWTAKTGGGTNIQ